MAARSTLANIITFTRSLINDPSSANQQFTDDVIQILLDDRRDDLRYEGLTIAPSIINNANTANQPQTTFSHYYSRAKFWEDDVIIQAYSGGLAWVVVTPYASDNLIGHWQFQASQEQINGTYPGQLPPVFATGKSFDPYGTAADLLEMWAATAVGNYDFTADAQSLHRSQVFTHYLKMAEMYKRRARTQRAKMVRNDIMSPIGSRRMRLLDQDDVVKGG